MKVEFAIVTITRNPNPTKNSKYLLCIDLEISGQRFQRFENYLTQREIYINTYATVDWLEYNNVPYRYRDYMRKENNK